MRRDVTQEQRGRSHLSLLTIIAEDQWVAKVGVVLTHKLASGALPKKGKVNTTGGREGGREGGKGGREGREVGIRVESLFSSIFANAVLPLLPAPPPPPLPSPPSPSPHLCTSLGSPLSRTQ